jgi:hypothetical protein
VITITGSTFALPLIIGIAASWIFYFQGNLKASSFALLAPVPHLIVGLIFICWVVMSVIANRT